MDYLHEIMNSRRMTGYKLMETIPLAQIIHYDDYKSNLVNRPLAKKFFEYVKQSRTAATKIWSTSNTVDSSVKYEQYTELKYAIKHMISKMKINSHTMYWILSKMDDEEYSSIKTTVWNLLCENKTEEFLELIVKSKEPVSYLEEVPYKTDIKIHNYYFEEKERLVE